MPLKSRDSFDLFSIKEYSYRIPEMHDSVPTCMLHGYIVKLKK